MHFFGPIITSTIFQNFLNLNNYLSVKQVFSEMDFLGWYTTGDSPNESDIKVHKQVRKSILFPLLITS